MCNNSTIRACILYITVYNIIYKSEVTSHRTNIRAIRVEHNENMYFCNVYRQPEKRESYACTFFTMAQSVDIVRTKTFPTAAMGVVAQQTRLFCYALRITLDLSFSLSTTKIPAKSPTRVRICDVLQNNDTTHSIAMYFTMK